MIVTEDLRRLPRLQLDARRLLGWIATLLLIAVWAATFRPVALGGPAAFVGIDGRSMQPTMYEGDMAVARERSSYGVGDIVAYRVPRGEAGEGNNIIHRIVGGNGIDGFTTQGDNNSYTDVWRPTEDDIIGEVWFKVPNLAGILGHLRTPWLLALIVGLVTFVVMLLPDRKKPAEPVPAVEVVEGPTSKSATVTAIVVGAAAAFLPRRKR